MNADKSSGANLDAMAASLRPTTFQPILLRPKTGERERQTVVRIRPGYARRPASAYKYKSTSLSPWLANFYCNLVSRALDIGSRDIPVDFTTRDGIPMHLDAGCVSMAAHAGFIEPLKNARDGKVGHITLRWLVHPKERS